VLELTHALFLRKKKECRIYVPFLTSHMKSVTQLGTISRFLVHYCSSDRICSGVCVCCRILPENWEKE